MAEAYYHEEDAESIMQNNNNSPGPSETPVLSCKGIWKVFGATPAAFEGQKGHELDDAAIEANGWTAAVRDASFDIPRGEIFVIMGLSGSGKSTLVRCLSRLIEPTTGQLHVDGQDLLGANEQELIKIRREKMGMVFQHFALLPNRYSELKVIFNKASKNAIQCIVEDSGIGRKAAEKFKKPWVLKQRKSSGLQTTKERIALFNQNDLDLHIDFNIIDLVDDHQKAKGTRVEFLFTQTISK